MRTAGAALGRGGGGERAYVNQQSYPMISMCVGGSPPATPPSPFRLTLFHGTLVGGGRPGIAGEKMSWQTCIIITESLLMSGRLPSATQMAKGPNRFEFGTSLNMGKNIGLHELLSLRICSNLAKQKKSIVLCRLTCYPLPISIFRPPLCAAPGAVAPRGPSVRHQWQLLRRAHGASRGGIAV